MGDLFHEQKFHVHFFVMKKVKTDEVGPDQMIHVQPLKLALCVCDGMCFARRQRQGGVISGQGTR